MSQPVRDEIADVLHRPRLARFVKPELRDEVLALQLRLRGRMVQAGGRRRFDCRDPL